MQLTDRIKAWHHDAWKKGDGRSSTTPYDTLLRVAHERLANIRKSREMSCPYFVGQIPANEPRISVYRDPIKREWLYEVTDPPGEMRVWKPSTPPYGRDAIRALIMRRFGTLTPEE